MHKLKTLINMKPGAGTGSPEEMKKIEERIDALEEKQVKEYGVRYYFGQASSGLEMPLD